MRLEAMNMHAHAVSCLYVRQVQPRYLIVGDTPQYLSDTVHSNIVGVIGIRNSVLNINLLEDYPYRRQTSEVVRMGSDRDVLIVSVLGSICGRSGRAH